MKRSEEYIYKTLNRKDDDYVFVFKNRVELIEFLDGYVASPNWDEIAKELVLGIFGKEESEDSDIVAFYADVNKNAFAALAKELPSPKQEGETAEEILIALVDLKDHKDKSGKTDLYLEMQPKLWETARKVVTGLTNKE